STGSMIALTKDTVQQKFGVRQIPGSPVSSDVAMDSIKKDLYDLEFYKGLVFNDRTNATLMAVSFDTKLLNTAARNDIIREITNNTSAFEVSTGIPVHLSGLPFIRTATSKLVSTEFVLFLGLSILVSALILLVFFRNVYAVLFPVLVVIAGVVWSLGCLVLFGYEITFLTGLVPPLIVIIGIPNSILILNRYRSELRRVNNREQAMQTAIARVAVTTLIANVTAAIGFGVLCFTGSALLVEFGAIAALNVMFTWIICLCLIPIIFSWLPTPKLTPKEERSSVLDKLLLFVDKLVVQNSKSCPDRLLERDSKLH
ncbi:MAG: Fis family transcriptional regulator, partial [Sphingobacteriales bacterium]